MKTTAQMSRVTGGKAAAITNKKRHGEDFYKRIGALGGAKSSPFKGFGADRGRASIAGAKGGKKSRRGKNA